MKWVEALRYGKNLTSCVSKLLSDDTFSKQLDLTGGFIALIISGIQIAQKIRDELMPYNDRAYHRFSKFVLYSTEELLNEVKNEPNRSLKDTEKNPDIDHNIDNNWIKQKIENLFDKSDNQYELKWNSVLQDHPIISDFKNSMHIYFKNILQWDDANLSFLLRRFDQKLIEKAREDENYRYFNKWWEENKHYYNLVEYVKYIAKIENLDEKRLSPTGSESKSLKDYYVQNSALLLPIEKWNLSDETCRNIHVNQNLEVIIRNFLEKEEPLYLVVAATFGTGKTTRFYS